MMYNIIKDIDYAGDGNPQHLGNMFIPESEVPHPVVLCIHGGWNSMDRISFAGVAGPLQIFFFEVPLSALKHEINDLKIFVSPFGEFFLSALKKNDLYGIELALYKKN